MQSLMIFKTQDLAAIFLKVTACPQHDHRPPRSRAELTPQAPGSCGLKTHASWSHCFPDPDPHELFPICSPECWSQ